MNSRQQRHEVRLRGLQAAARGARSVRGAAIAGGEVSLV
jgi:hypothetical protein